MEWRASGFHSLDSEEGSSEFPYIIMTVNSNQCLSAAVDSTNSTGSTLCDHQRCVAMESVKGWKAQVRGEYLGVLDERSSPKHPLSCLVIPYDTHPITIATSHKA